MKRQRGVPATQPQRQSSPRKWKISGNDHISKLPDDILYTIILLLSMRDAVRTSVLSRRWKNMYAYISNLEFDWHNITPTPVNYNCGTVPKGYVRHFLGIIDRFLARHLGTKVVSFKVSCCFGSMYAHRITDWIIFSVRKGVESLDLAFTCDKPAERHDWRTVDYYPFPTQLFLHGEESKLRHLSLRSVTLWSDFSDRFRTLSTLVLCDVNLAGPVEPRMFSSCLNLERLTLQWCFGLERLCLGDSLHRLKVLTVSLCDGLKGIELSATNLTIFHYKGDDTELSFERVPNLEEVCVVMKGINVITTFARLEKELPHVKTMTVTRDYLRKSGLLTIQQRLGVWTSVLFNIQDSSSLLEVLPLLQKFHLASNLRCIDCCCRCPI
ncbi:hypothetical protein FF1_026067 [Malus domestica]